MLTEVRRPAGGAGRIHYPFVFSLREMFARDFHGDSGTDLRRPIYKATAAFGHFGRTGDSFSWEKMDKAEALNRASKKVGAA